MVQQQAPENEGEGSALPLQPPSPPRDALTIPFDPSGDVPPPELMVEQQAPPENEGRGSAPPLQPPSPTHSIHPPPAPPVDVPTTNSQSEHHPSSTSVCPPDLQAASVAQDIPPDEPTSSHSAVAEGPHNLHRIDPPPANLVVRSVPSSSVPRLGL
ncbi:hypothetical protein K435DRAFT_696712 [Dendrothele bispora CBS 962.96]|uniref:Uncharacterized protein n=1 Tax=Dendrothele bispora (strain CBS 962.96) TaxID=1314807 RepID=A0A4S8KVL8_DENBC|nr:hypothetical protein K435DRAFT_696712 [Dendrothele bispora CBS 962.96]